MQKDKEIYDEMPAIIAGVVFFFHLTVMGK